jgi:ELWxxDGT repeat protein
MIPRRVSFHWPALIVSMALSIASAKAQTARLVKDANRTAGSFRTGINWVMPVGQGQGAVFPMDTLAHGSELWTSDGTPGGTRLLKDFVPGPGTSYLHSPVAFGAGASARVALINEVWSTGADVWVTDGTEAGTVRAFQDPSREDGVVRLMAGTTGGVFFESWSWGVGSRLFFSDGTPGGTRELNPMEGGARQFSYPHSYTTSGRWCYFVGNEGEIWRSDGTEAGTTKLTTAANPSAGRFRASAGSLFMQISAGPEAAELWTCTMDGGELTRLGPPADTEWAMLEEMIDGGDDVFFMAVHANYDHKLWASDGTEAGTRRIPLMHDGAESFPWGSGMTAWNGSIYLTAENENGTEELWRTDGTPGGTIRLASFPQGFAYLVPYEVPESAEFFHFHGYTANGQWELWRTKGDAASTRRVRGAPGSYPFAAQGSLLAEGNDGLFFVGGQTTPDEALWRTRGNAAGAVRLTHPEKTSGPGITAYATGAEPYEMLDGTLLALVNTGRGHELWRMNPDGSRSRSIWKAPAPLDEGYGLAGFRGITANGALFTFSTVEGPHQVWATDGTRRGTRLLSDHGAATDDTHPQDFVKAGEVWYYSVTNEIDPAKASLWKTDGTPAGTSMVVTADGNMPGPNAGEMVAFEDRLYFLATGLDGTTALWRSDGTASGTVRLKDTWYGQPGEEAVGLSVAGGKLILSVRGANSEVLWQSNGTVEGTVPVTPYAIFPPWDVSPALDLEGVAIFQASGQWWRHDATGTRAVRDYVADRHVDWYSNSRLYAVVGGQLFYSGIEDDDAELWVTDGTSSGSRRVKDLYPGTLSSAPREMLAVGDVIYFSARDELHGHELWRSDGTEAGTLLVADIEPGPADSAPQGLKVMDGKLYFSAQRRDVGRELFVIDLPAE